MSQYFREHPRVLSGLFCLSGALATLVLLWPGFITYDAIRQYYQAETHQYNNWHPVVMALWWSALNVLHSGMEPMFLFQVLTYWAALYVFSGALCAAKLPQARYAPLIGFLPFLIVFSGMIFKDTNLVVVWALAFSVIFRSSLRAEEKGWVFWIFVVILCLCYGVLVRHNAALAFLPLAVFAFRTYRPGWGLRAALLVSVVSMLVIAVPLKSAIERAAGARQNSMLSVIFLYDLAGIAAQGSDMVLPAYIRSNPGYSREELLGDYRPDNCVTIMVKPNAAGQSVALRDAEWWANGPYLDSVFCENINDHVAEIRQAWLGAVLHHPLAYFVHRAKVFRSFLRLGYASPYGVYRSDLKFPPASEGSPGIPLVRRAFMGSLFATSILFPVLYKPYFWLVLMAVSGTAVARYRGDSNLRIAAVSLLLSSLLYVLPLFFVLPAVEFRYAYWAVFAIVMAMTIVALDCMREKRLLFDRRILQVGVLALIFAMGLDVALCLA